MTYQYELALASIVYGVREELTSQFVAVNGTLEKIHPFLEPNSPVSLTYLSVRMTVSPPKSHQRLCISESR
jgi:hypothetical protein